MTSQLPDAENGQEASGLEGLWREFSADLGGYIARRVSRPEDAEDIRQIVFLRMSDGLAELRDQDRLLGWMYAVTRNAITDFYRSAAHRREVAVDELPDRPDAEATDGALTPDDREAQRELAGCLRPMLSRLPADQAAALTLVDLEGVSQTEAAGRAGISVPGMKSRVQRGRARLRELLLECCSVSQDTRGHVHDYRPRDSES